MSLVINENTSSVLYKGSYSDCDCFIGENDLRNEDHIMIFDCEYCDGQMCPYYNDCVTSK